MYRHNTGLEIDTINAVLHKKTLERMMIFKDNKSPEAFLQLQCVSEGENLLKFLLSMRKWDNSQEVLKTAFKCRWCIFEEKNVGSGADYCDRETPYWLMSGCFGIILHSLNFHFTSLAHKTQLLRKIQRSHPSNTITETLPAVYTEQLFWLDTSRRMIMSYTS